MRPSARRALGDLKFDAVADFISFVPEHIQAGIELFAGRTGQFIFISSASAYKKPVDNWPLTESTPLHNPHWQYSRNKIACEELLIRAYRESGFPATIVRPSHTYDKTLLPFDPYQCGYTVLQRLQQGKPVVLHGDGTSLWVFTHHRDFAKGFVGLLGNPKAVGEAFHITSDEVLTWNEIYGAVARAAGCTPHLVHVPSAIIARDTRLGRGLARRQDAQRDLRQHQDQTLRPRLRVHHPICARRRGNRRVLRQEPQLRARQPARGRANGPAGEAVRGLRPFQNAGRRRWFASPGLSHGRRRTGAEPRTTRG